jgi:hypothetical protein
LESKIKAAKGKQEKLERELQSTKKRLVELNIDEEEQKIRSVFRSNFVKQFITHQRFEDKCWDFPVTRSESFLFLYDLVIQQTYRAQSKPLSRLDTAINYYANFQRIFAMRTIFAKAISLMDQATTSPPVSLANIS